MLPQKTFLMKNCELYESDFDVTQRVKPHRIMELMQDAATAHADKLGIGWDYMNSKGLFWIVSKIKVVFHKPLIRQTHDFKLYTWPVASNRIYCERRFEAVDANNEQLFSSSSLWMIVERDTRKICSREVAKRYYDFDFDEATCNCDGNFDRVRMDETYNLVYQRQLRRCDLDINRHVNNTHYVNYALDALDENTKVTAFEIVYNKELKLGDVISVYTKYEGDTVYVVGARGDETCFTAKLTVEM